MKQDVSGCAKKQRLRGTPRDCSKMANKNLITLESPTFSPMLLSNDLFWSCDILAFRYKTGEALQWLKLHCSLTTAGCISAGSSDPCIHPSIRLQTGCSNGSTQLTAGCGERWSDVNSNWLRSREQVLEIQKCSCTCKKTKKENKPQEISFCPFPVCQDEPLSFRSCEFG